jgi:hypothetical protein
VLWAIALAGVAGSSVTVALALTTERTSEPEWQAGLIAWIVLTYTVGGAVAWWRRPDSGFGPLMAAAGGTMFLSSLYFADSAAVFTVGQAFDLIPAALFLHVFLAYPSGRLGGVVERVVVVVAYACAVGLQVVNMTLGNYGPDNLLEVTQDPDAGLVVTRVQLTTLSACMLAGVVILVVRRRAAGRPGRLWVALADRLVRPRARDDRLPAHQRRLGQGGLPVGPAGGALRHRPRPGRVPHRAPRRALGPLLGRRPVRRPRRRAVRVVIAEAACCSARASSAC